MPSELPPELVDLAQKRAGDADALELRRVAARGEPSDSQRELALAVLAALSYGRKLRGEP